MSDVSETPRCSVLLIGGPDAGKSNYLFRSWIAIDDGRGAMVKDGLPMELEYLRDGSERLLEGEFAGRTSEDVHERIEIPVRSSPSIGAERHGVLVVPDMPGEQIRAIYRNRQWPQAWEDHVSDCCGCLIFVRASSKENVVPLDWATCIELYGAAMAPPAGTGAPETKPDPAAVSGAVVPRVEVKPAKQSDSKGEDQKYETPTQVLLTEWMQFLRLAIADLAGGGHRPRIGIVVSAWDAVPTDQRTAGPAAYLKDNFPLLHQFFETNGDELDLQVFGVSIVSGDLKEDVEFRKTYQEGNPREFGYTMHSLFGDLRRDADVTLPIAWALGFVGTDSH